MTEDARCRSCGKPIRPGRGKANAGTWVHADTGSKWCDQSGTVEARPR